MKVELLDVVLLKDGREAAIVEKFSDTDFLVDVGTSPADWDTIPMTADQFERVIYRYQGPASTQPTED